MKHKVKPTWIVVMDSSTARFYVLRQDEGGRRIEEAADAMESGLHRHSADVKSDRPGRGFRSGNSTARHAMEPPQDFHKLEKHDFVHAVAQKLRAAHDAHEFERLAVVAPERSLGELRNLLPDNVKNAVWREIAKDLVKLNDQELWARVAPALEEHLGTRV